MINKYSNELFAQPRKNYHFEHSDITITLNNAVDNMMWMTSISKPSDFAKYREKEREILTAKLNRTGAALENTRRSSRFRPAAYRQLKWLPNAAFLLWIHGRAGRTVESPCELQRVGHCADHTEAIRTVFHRHEPRRVAFLPAILAPNLKQQSRKNKLNYSSLRLT